MNEVQLAQACADKPYDVHISFDFTHHIYSVSFTYGVSFIRTISEMDFRLFEMDGFIQLTETELYDFIREALFPNEQEIARDEAKREIKSRLAREFGSDSAMAEYIDRL